MQRGWADRSPQALFSIALLLWTALPASAVAATLADGGAAFVIGLLPPSSSVEMKASTKYRAALHCRACTVCGGSDGEGRYSSRTGFSDNQLRGTTCRN